jgi:hypothetical protein
MAKLFLQAATGCRICFVIALSAYLMYSEQGSWSALLPTIDTRICGTLWPLILVTYAVRRGLRRDQL